MRPLSDIAEEYDFLDSDERYRLLIELGRELEALVARAVDELAVEEERQLSAG